ncbi:hypothetical protein [Terrimicrobium sacchariphilum]|uniref:hypothetical protein n=1 Tax=Terrimicrobium sacchariphilum TaxID=690879 RepID=UPI00129A23A1|nr:hypothetical protein [Terrimicrobium sacchariphilum]
MKRFLFLGLALVLVGCASSYEKTVAYVNTLPVEQHPAYLKSSLELGKISQAQYDRMMAIWRNARAEDAAEAKLIASMTPVEQANYKIEKERLAIQRQQLLVQQQQLEQSRRAADAQAVNNIMSSAQSNAQANAQTLNNMANTQAVTTAIYGSR